MVALHAKVNSMPSLCLHHKAATCYDFTDLYSDPKILNFIILLNLCKKNMNWADIIVEHTHLSVRDHPSNEKQVFDYDKNNVNRLHTYSLLVNLSKISSRNSTLSCNKALEYTLTSLNAV